MNDENKVSLIPCPFCGGESELCNRHYCNDMQFDDDHDEFYGRCKECGATGKTVEVLNARYLKNSKEKLEQAEKEAAAYWNRRTCLCKQKEN